MKRYCIVGLGNPGSKYKNTRHNLGFDVLDFLVENFSTDQQKENRFELSKKFKGEIFKKDFKRDKIIFLKPQTFMNMSGICVKNFVDFYKIDLENLIIIHDEIDLALGELKISFNSGSGGHKGVQSIINEVGNKNFYRLKVGIRNNKFIDQTKIPTEKFVLGYFFPEEKKILNKINKKVYQGIELFLENKKQKAIQKINSK